MKVKVLTLREIVKNIKQGIHFEATLPEGGFVIKVNNYVPYICTAIHSGSKIRSELKSKIALDEYERWYEEDPYTDDFISSMPITISGLDSRFEYDLNRDPETCIYTEAWGKNVWKKKLTAKDIKLSKQKHSNYYKVLDALVNKIEELYGSCLLYDIHSYNYKRWDREVPVFNIGTENIDTAKFGDIKDHWLSELSKIEIPNIQNVVKENDVFFGRGYNLAYLREKYPNTIVLATEISKIYCDEETGDVYPKIVNSIQKILKTAILNNANYFGSKLDNWKHISAPKLLDKGLDRGMLKIDEALYKMLKSFELLSVINPANSRSEKKKFLKNKYNVAPKFNYTPIKIDTYSLKQDLLALNLDEIGDVNIRGMYQDVIRSYFDKIDMIASLNSDNFLYNSLRYFGRPSKVDISNASYILHLPDVPGEAKKQPVFTGVEAKEYFQKALEEYGIDAKIELSKKVISQVMVLNSKKSVLIQPESKFKLRDLGALIEHEIGIHMVTTINSNEQKLKVFNLGLPHNTKTQEGMAILSEYLSGNMSLARLKKLALRVIAVDMMADGADFIEVFDELVNEYDVDENDAYVITVRVFRGGGFTKDHVYLSGFVRALKLWNQDVDFKPLLVGKTSIEYINTIEEMIARDMVYSPKFLNRSFMNPQEDKNNPIYKYILSGLK